MPELIPVVIGISGLADGEVFMLGDRGDLTIGRSRSCEVSFQRFRRFLSMTPAEQKLRDSYNAAVSRRHLRIRTNGTVAILENLSSGGSWCNDQRFDAIHEVDLATGPVSVRLGQAAEVFKLTLLARDHLEAMLATQPPQPGTGTIAKPAVAGVPDPVEDPTPKASPSLNEAATPMPGDETIPAPKVAAPPVPTPPPVPAKSPAPAPVNPPEPTKPPGDLDQSIYL